MKTLEQLKTRIKELGKQMTGYSRQGIDLIKQGDRKNGHELMKQAYETSKRCQVLINELKRQSIR